MRKWVTAILIIGLFILSVLSGFILKSFISFSKNDKQDEPAVLAENKREQAVDVNASDVIVSPMADVILTESYKKCGHTITTKDVAPREIVNLNREGVEKYYEGWSVDEFSANEVRLSRKSAGICGEHYILRESDGYISISCKNDIGEYIFKGLTDISVQYLAEQDLAKLEEGIEVYGRENLNKVLEDFE